ncbi:MAG TPA: hypothetical protein V6D14_08555 [Coleofasciculaceae cyanobacterium]
MSCCKSFRLSVVFSAIAKQTSDRKDLLKDISELSSVIVALGGKEALAQTARAITEVGRQWS